MTAVSSNNLTLGDDIKLKTKMRFNIVEISKECAKGLLLILNGLCMFTAILVFSFAVVDTRILKQYGEDQAIGTFAGDMIIIGVSILLILVAVFGCVGVIRENVKILYLYVGFIMILVILELLVGIFVAVQRCGLQIKVTDWLREDFFKNVSSEELTLHDRVWDELQTSYECCGLNGPDDYPATQKQISLSCCPRAYRARTAHAQQQLYKTCVQTKSYYDQGCEEEILEILYSDANWLLGVAVISFWFEAAGLLLAMWVANNLKNSVKVYKTTVKY